MIAMIYYDDIFWPEGWQEVEPLLAEFDDETLALAITCEAYCAECELTRN